MTVSSSSSTDNDRARFRFWIVSEQYYPQETATGYLLTELAEGLASLLPTTVNVLCLKPGRTIVDAELPDREERKGVSIYRSRATSFDKDKLFLRLINVITGSLALFFDALRLIGKDDVVLVVTNPPSLPFFVHIANRIKGGKTILLIYDVYPEAAVVAGVLKEGGWAHRFLDRLNKWLYRNVQHIVVLGQDMRELVIEKLGEDEEHITVIPNWADIDKVSPQLPEDNSLLTELGLVDKFVIQYVGNMARVNDIETVVQSAIQLASEDDIHFLFIGSGAKREWLKRVVNEKQLRNVTILPPRPRSDQNNFLNACEVGIISLCAKMKGVSVPSRSYNIMAAGRPILAIMEPGSEMDRVIRKADIGWSIPPGRSDVLAQTIRRIRFQRDVVREKGRRARELAEQEYALSSALEKYRQVIHQTDSRKE